MATCGPTAPPRCLTAPSPSACAPRTPCGSPTLTRFPARLSWPPAMAMPPGWASTRTRSRCAICGLIAPGGRPANTGPRHADPEGLPGRSRSTRPGSGPSPALLAFAAYPGPFAALGGQDAGVAGVGVASAQAVLEFAGRRGVVRVVRAAQEKSADRTELRLRDEPRRRGRTGPPPRRAGLRRRVRMTSRGRERPGPGGLWLLLVPAASLRRPAAGRGASPWPEPLAWGGLGGAGCPAGRCHAGSSGRAGGLRGGLWRPGGPGSPDPAVPGFRDND